MTVFSFTREFQVPFQYSCTNYMPTLPYEFSPIHMLQKLLSISAILDYIKCYATKALISIFLITNEVENHLCLLTFLYSLLEQAYYCVLLIFLMAYFIIDCTFLYIVNNNYLTVTCMKKISKIVAIFFFLLPSSCLSMRCILNIMQNLSIMFII